MSPIITASPGRAPTLASAASTTSGAGLESSTSSLRVSSSISSLSPACPSRTSRSSASPELATTSFQPRLCSSRQRSRAPGKARISRRYLPQKMRPFSSAIRLPSGLQTSIPVSEGISWSPPIPIRRRICGQGFTMPCSDKASRKTRACASFESTSVPSTSRITAFSGEFIPTPRGLRWLRWRPGRPPRRSVRAGLRSRPPRRAREPWSAVSGSW